MNAEDRLIIDSQPEALAEARDWLTDRASRAGLPPDTVSDLKLAPTEAVSHVMLHTYGGEPRHQIILSLVTDHEALTLTICDFWPSIRRQPLPDA
jgi:anti-sigma regulatory factor (Ser/Thr protein kinase)